MSKFYGQVMGASRTAGTRRGYHDIMVSAQSYSGSIQTRLYYGPSGVLMVDIYAADGSTGSGTLIYNGTFDEYKARLTA